MLWVCPSVPSGNFVTSWTPFLNLIVLVASSYIRKFGNPVTVVDLMPLPPGLSVAATLISGNVLSSAIKSQFCLSVGVWIVGFVTSFTSSGIVTESVVSSRYVTVALIVLFPNSAVLIVPTGVTDFTLLLPLLLIVTAAFSSSFVTDSFWFFTILVPVGSYSSANLRTLTVTFTVSFESSGYVTVTTPALSPGPVIVLGAVVHIYAVPAGNPFLFTLVPASGVVP